MTSSASCRLLTWDTSFFQKRIARIDSMRLDDETIKAVHAFGRREAIDCFYFLTDAVDEESRAIAEANRFQWVDTRVTLGCSVSGGEERSALEVSPARESDLESIKAIARVSHTTTRFYHDARFPRERCDALYEEWIAGAYKRSPENLLVVRNGQDAQGYVTCELAKDGTGGIGLIAVREDARGQSIGRALLQGAFTHLQGKGCSRLRVVSQERNRAAARLYEGAGFQVCSRERWYHFWPDKESNE